MVNHARRGCCTVKPSDATTWILGQMFKYLEQPRLPTRLEQERVAATVPIKGHSHTHARAHTHTHTEQEHLTNIERCKLVGDGFRARRGHCGLDLTIGRWTVLGAQRSNEALEHNVKFNVGATEHQTAHARQL